jgi:translation initiation factor IF-1
VSPRGAIVVEAVVEAMLDGRVARARLANGHRFIACVPRGARPAGAALAVGERLRVRFSPCDLSRGWIMRESEVKQ